MAYGFQRLIELVRESYPSLKGQVSPQWAAKQPQYREQIRASIKENVPMKDHLGLEDLSRPPRPAEWSLSISHAQSLGGWLAIPLPARIGFDLEAAARIREEVVQRMSTPQEIAQAPDPAFLWCAKESYFKSLAQDQPQAITQLNIGGWEKIDSQAYLFAASPHKPGKGWIVRDGELLLGACIV